MNRRREQKIMPGRRTVIPKRNSLKKIQASDSYRIKMERVISEIYMYEWNGSWSENSQRVMTGIRK